MIKTTVKNNLPFTYNPDHPRAHYTLDGVHYMNAGQLKQILRVYSLFGRVDTPDHIPYDIGSDIPELKESVKSNKATLVNRQLGSDFDSSLNVYLNTTASETFSWVRLIDDELITYVMNKAEFEEFTRAFAKFDKSRKVIRFGQESARMMMWFEARV